MVVADLCHHSPGTCQILQSHIIHMVTEHPPGKGVLVFPDDHLICLRPDPGHKHPAAHGQIQPSALSDGIMADSSVRPQHPAVPGDKISRWRYSVRGFPVDKGPVVMVRNKTDLLAVRLLSHREAQFLCNLPDFPLCIRSHRHQRAGKLILGQAVQGISLVFLRCHRIPDGIAPVIQPVHPGIMACGYIIRPQFQAAPQQGFPFYISVTGDTGVGGPPLKVFLHKVIYHLLFELPPEVHHIMRDTQSLRHPSGVLHCRQAAASPLPGLLRGLFLLPDLHGDADHLISLLL